LSFSDHQGIGLRSPAWSAELDAKATFSSQIPIRVQISLRQALARGLTLFPLCLYTISSIPLHLAENVPAASSFLCAISAAPCSSSSKLLACLSSSFLTLSIVLVRSLTRFSECAIWVSIVTISGFYRQLEFQKGERTLSSSSFSPFLTLASRFLTSRVVAACSFLVSFSFLSLSSYHKSHTDSGTHGRGT
jgi:hypothetical protein